MALADTGLIGPRFGLDIRPGRIGIVGPAGSASQEVGARIHDFTGGVSQAIATSRRDLSRTGDASATLEGIAALEADPATAVVVVVAVNPDPRAARRIVQTLASVRKPTVACVIGADPETVAAAAESGVVLHTCSKPAALGAVVASGVDERTLDLHALNRPLIADVQRLLDDTQTDVRGLFASSALCAEAVALFRETHDDVRTNVFDDPGPSAAPALPAGPGHVLLDLGTDEARRGAAHPKADSRDRARRLIAEAVDPRVGVVVLDVVLGGDTDPLGDLLPAIAEGKRLAAEGGRHLEVLVYLLGTDAQGLAQQAARLDAVGATWASSATNTGLLAREFVVKG